MATIHVEELLSAAKFKAGLSRFTYEDYEARNIDIDSSDDPYGYLHICSKNNEALFRLYSSILLDDAIEKGAHEKSVRDWIYLCEEIIEFDADTATTPTSRTTLVRDGVRIPLILGDEYEIDNGEIYYLKGKQRERICRHIILPIGILKNRENELEIIEITDNHDGEWHFRSMKKSMAFKPSGITRLVDYGIDVAQGAAKKLSAFLQTVEYLNRENLPTTYVSDHIGWNNDFSEFIPYDGRVKYVKEHEFSDEFTCIKESKGTLDEWLSLLRIIRNEEHIPERIALATSFASVLIKPMSASPFMLDIWGGAGIGKSTLLVAAASIWAYPEMDGAYISTFNATPISNEQKALFCCDLPLMLDEMQTIQNKKSYEEYVYKLCEGKPRGRATASGGLRSQGSWHNTILVTGEQPIVNESSMGGAQRRVVNLECKDRLFHTADDVFGNLRERLRSCYGTAGRLFIDYLLSEGNRQWAHDLLEENKTLLAQHANGSQNLPGALILTADTLAETWIFKDNVKLSVNDIAAYLRSDVVSDMYERTHEAIAQWIIGNQQHIIPIDKFSMPNGARPIGRRMKHKDSDIYAILCTELKAMMETRHLKLDGYLSWAARNGKIITAKNGTSHMINVKFGSGSDSLQTSCYAFIVNQLNMPNR